MSILSIFTGKGSRVVVPVAPAGKRPPATKSRLVGAGAGVAGVSMLALVTGEALRWENLETESYRDVVGIWTACIGETQNIGPGMKFTKAECHAMFAKKIVEFEAGMRKCLKAPEAIPEKTYAAFLIGTYNIGTAGFCGSATASIGMLVAGFLSAAAYVEVYAPATDYVVKRVPGIDRAPDRVVLKAHVEKRLDCELERGDGPPWVDFYDANGDVPPSSAFYRPDGSVAASTLIGAGEALVIEGYSAVVPNLLRGLEGTFVVKVPCQLWTTDAAGERVYGRKVIAGYGPIIVPPPGSEVASVHGVVTFHWRTN